MMKSSIASSGKTKSELYLRKESRPVNQILRKSLLLCGILSSLLYVAMNIYVPTLFNGYHSASYTISELSAIGSPTRAVWVPLGIVYTLLVAAFGLGIWQSAFGNRYLRIAGSLVFVYGIIGLLWVYAPMHQREVIAAGKSSMTDTMHIVMGIVSVVFMLAAIGFGAKAFGKRFRIYTIASMMMFLVFGILTFLDAPKMDANLPTPWIGVWERINIGVFLLWVIMMAIILLGRGKGHDAT